MKSYDGIRIPETFQELTSAVYRHYKSNKGKTENRVKLIKYIKKFHTEANTLTNGVEESLELLKEDCIFLFSGHQPNLIPYSGVVRKLTLMEAVKRKLEDKYSIPAVCFFEFTDQAFPDRWVRTTQLPDILRKDGFLELINSEIEKDNHYRLTGYGKYPIRINAIKKPSLNLMSNWKMEIRKWIKTNLKLSRRLAKKYDYEIPFQQIQILFKNGREFMKLLEEAYEQAKNYADFNAFLLAKITQKFGYSTLFANSSDINQIFRKEVLFLLENFSTYFQALKKARSIMNKSTEIKLLPIWYSCECGGKVGLRLKKTFKGKCFNCNKAYEFNLASIRENDEFFSKLSFRAIPLMLIYSNGLRPNLYVGGIGGLKSYYPELKIVANELGVKLPIIGVWNPKDIYAGIGQIHGFLEYKNSSNEKALKVLNHKYSILDYAFNVGLKETSEQWLDYLLNGNTNLKDNIHLKSIFDSKLSEDLSKFQTEVLS